MGTYTILPFAAGEYAERQRAFNAAADRDPHGGVYIEQHLNGVDDPRVCRAEGLYLLRATDDGSRSLAEEYARTATDRCPVPMTAPRGVPLREGDRGHGNLRHLRYPGICAEPGFASHPGYAAWVLTDEGADVLAGLLRHVVRGSLPHGGVVGLSVGHVGRASRPGDRGVVLAGHPDIYEADVCARVVAKAAQLLSSP